MDNTFINWIQKSSLFPIKFKIKTYMSYRDIQNDILLLLEKSSADISVFFVQLITFALIIRWVLILSF